MNEETDYDRWQEEGTENQNIISKLGQKDVLLKKDGELISKETWGLEILNNIRDINDKLNLGKERIIDLMIEKIKNNQLTYAYKIEKK